MTDLADAVSREILLALQNLGTRPAVLERLDLFDTAQVFEVAQAGGASFELLCAIGSRGDSLSDEDVLRYLRAFNDHGTIFREVKAEVDEPME